MHRPSLAPGGPRGIRGLLGMLVGHDRIKRLFGVPLEETDAARAAHVVDCFLRAYEP